MPLRSSTAIDHYPFPVLGREFSVACKAAYSLGTLVRIPSHYHLVLLLTSAVLRKDCSKFWPKRYAHFQAAIPQSL